MITSRGWWFLLIDFALLALGVFGGRWTLALIGLTLLLWFIGDWFLFVLRLRFAVPVLRLRRELRDECGPVDTLWVGRGFQVHVEVRLPHWLSLPYVQVAEYLPFGVERQSGLATWEGALTAEEPSVLMYRMRCPAAGRVRFEGVGIQLADFQGFFYHATFLRNVAVYRVLPPLADAEGHRPTVKRHNLLPSPGQHRHLRAGSGSELLDLRDYLPGDPPKTIAWKVSARRDRLITKEFENEVPVRCTLFVDTSHSVRVGCFGQTALARLVELTAAVAQAAAGARDLTGLCLFDEKAVTTQIRPARGSRHIVQVLNKLADAAGLAPATGQARLATLLPLAYALAQDVYPELLRPEVNRVPGWLIWLWPLPAYTGRPSAFPKRMFRWLFIALAYLPFAVLALLFTAVPQLFTDLLVPLASVFLPVSPVMLAVIGCFLVVGVAVLYFPFVSLLYDFVTLRMEWRQRRRRRWRKQLAALLAERYGLAPGGLGIFLEDDDRLIVYLQRFLAEHHVPYPLPLYDRHGRYLFASPGKVDVLAKALIRAVGRGRDNELFVLLVDLLELIERLEPLRRAVKVALARHHQVVMICPWPPGVPPPSTQAATTLAAKPPLTAKLQSGNERKADLRLTVHEATTAHLHRAFRQLRQSFARLGVPLICAESGDPVRLILSRMDRMRSVGLGRKR